MPAQAGLQGAWRIRTAVQALTVTNLVNANKLEIALAVREAMREHRKGKPIAFQHPRRVNANRGAA